MQTITKTKAQLKALQTKAETLIQTLDKEVIVITGGKQHIDVKPGNAYELNVKEDNVLNKDFNSIAKKVGDDLEVLLSNNATVVFNGYFKICTSDLSCLVSLPAEGGVYHVVEGNFVTLSDGSKIVYSYGDEATLTSITSSQSSLFTDIFNEVYLSDGFSLAGVGGALAAVGLLANAGTTNNTMIPTIAITSDVNSLKAGQTAIITFTLSEVSTDFTAADVEVTGGRLSDFAPKAGEAKAYTATFIPTKNSTTAGEISVANDKFSDAAGNHNADDSDNSLSLAVDTVLPTIEITSDANSLKAGQTAIITFTLSEVSTDFTAADVEVTGGRLSNFAPKAGEAKAYTATFIPTKNSTTAGEISVANSKFSDTAGNHNADASDNSLSLTVDTMLPTIEITSDANSLKAGQTASITFTLSEVSTDFTAADVEVTGGRLSNFAPKAGEAKAYTATFIPTKNSTTAGEISVANSKFSDTAGNHNADASDNSLSLTVDTMLPTIEITSDANSLKAGQTASITFTLSEVSTDFTAADVEVTGGRLSNFAPKAGEAKAYTATFIPTKNSTTAGEISVANSKFSDTAGNHNADASDNSLSLTVDTMLPTIEITSDANSLKAGQTASITFTLSEVSTDFTAADIEVTGGRLSNFAPKAGEAKAYTATFTSTGTTAGKILVASDKFTDAAGNNNVIHSVSVIDTVLPTIEITSDANSLQTGQTASITFTLSEVSTDFTAADIEVTGGRLSDFAPKAGEAKAYTATFTSTGTTAGKILVASDKFTDAAGNNNVIHSVSVIDTVLPTIEITSDANSLKAGQTTSITFTLSEVSTDFTAADVEVTGGRLSDFAPKAGEAKAYTATFIPTKNSTIAGEISVANSKFSDTAGNHNADASDNSLSLTVDTMLPTIEITSDANSLKAGQTASITFTLSEVSTDFTAADVEVTGGRLSDFAPKAGEAKAYTATFTSTGTTAGKILVASDKFTDAAGNNNVIHSVSVIDTVLPTIAITSDVNSLKAGQTASITFTLSEVSTDFTAADIEVTGGRLSDFAPKAGEAKAYTATFIPTKNSTIAGEISVANSKFSDTAGNHNADASDNSLSLTVDTMLPTIEITSDANSLKAGQTASITFTLSEVSTDFTAADVEVTGGRLSDFAPKAGEAKAYTATFTSTGTTAGKILVASDKFTDAAGNNNVIHSVSVIDTVLPTIAITSDVNSLKAGQTASITFTLSEVSTDFTAADIEVTGGRLSDFAPKAGEAKAYTATFIPTKNSTIAGEISVANSKFSDTAGNHNADASDNSLSLTVDTMLPTIEITSDANSLKAGQTASITFTLSEVSTDFTAADVEVTGGRLSDFAPKAGEAKAYTATFTSTGTTAGKILVASDKFTDAAGNNNVIHSVSVIDTVLPTIAITSDANSLKAGQTASITFTLSEVSTDFTAADIEVTGGRLSDFAPKAGEAKAYTATFIPTKNSTIAGEISVANSKFSDTAGNHNADASDNSLSLTVDTMLPTIEITSDANSLQTGQTASITFTLSEVSTDFTAADVEVTGGRLSDFAPKAGEAKAYTATFTSTGTTAGKILVASDKFTDAAGNNNVIHSVSVIDTVLPTIAITSDVNSLKAGQTAIITFTLSEVSTDFTAADVEVTGGRLSDFAPKAGEAKAYTATFIPTKNSTTAGEISVANSKFSDTAGNHNADASDNSLSLTVDTMLPTIEITSDANSLKAGQTASITFTLSEVSTDFTAADVEVTGGRLSDFAPKAGEAKAYTATFTSTGTTAGKILVASDKFTDAAGNNNVIHSVSVIDTVLPTIAITSDANSLKAGQTASITFTLSEVSTDFTAADIEVTGGRLSDFAPKAGEAKAYTATFIPTKNSTIAGEISVASDKFSDTAGNHNADASDNSLSLTVDTMLPTIEITSDANSLQTGQTASITFTLSEVSTDFTAADVEVTGGRLSDFAPKAGEAKAYTATFTSTGTTAGKILVASDKFTDAAGNNNVIHSVSVIDTVLPTIAITSDVNSLKAGQTAIITFTLSEVSTDFTAADVEVTGGRLSDFAPKAGEAKAYTATFIPTKNSTTAGEILVANSKFSDTAGNHNADASDTNNSLSLTIDIALVRIVMIAGVATAMIGSDIDNIFVYSGEAGLTSIDGKGGDDIVVLSGASSNLDTTVVALNSIESIHMQNDKANLLTLANTQLTTNTSVLSVLMGSGDSIVYEGNILNYSATQEEVIFGTTGDDSINIFSSFNQLVYGRGGSDLFFYSDTSASSDNYAIADFTIGNAADKDTLNLVDLLVDYNSTTDNISNFLSLSNTGSNTSIAIDKNGDKSGTDLTITLIDVTEVSLGNMMSDSNLILE